MTQNRRKKILVVDDSPTSLAFAAKRLRSFGYEVETADTLWISALVNRFRPDLVLMDVNLGVSLKGTSAIKALRGRRYTEQCRFVLYSDLPQAELGQMTADCGADGFICKQETGELLSQVERLLEKAPNNRVSVEEMADHEKPRSKAS